MFSLNRYSSFHMPVRLLSWNDRETCAPRNRVQPAGAPRKAVLFTLPRRARIADQGGKGTRSQVSVYVHEGTTMPGATSAGRTSWGELAPTHLNVRPGTESSSAPR